MNLHGYLQERQGLIDRTLHPYIGKSPLHPEKLFKAMQYSVFSGGKRIRPILTLAVGGLFGSKQKNLSLSPVPWNSFIPILYSMMIFLTWTMMI